MKRLQMKKTHKGFTLVELLLTLSMTVVVLSGIYTFFFSSYKANMSVDDEMEIQSQSEKAINFIVDNLMDSQGMAMINNDTHMADISGTQSLGKFAVRREDTTNLSYCSIFQMLNGKLYYLKSSNNNYLVDNDLPGLGGTAISSYISNAYLTALPLGSNFKNAKGVKIEIKLSYKDKTKTVNNTVYFRNKQ